MFGWDLLNLNVDPAQTEEARNAAQAIEGFGACFNELGWTSLNALSELAAGGNREPQGRFAVGPPIESAKLLLQAHVPLEYFFLGHQ